MHFYCLHGYLHQLVLWTCRRHHHWTNSSCYWDIQDTSSSPTHTRQLSNTPSPCPIWYLPSLSRPRCPMSHWQESLASHPATNSSNLSVYLPSTWWWYLALGGTTKVILDSSKIWSYISSARARHPRFQRLLRQLTTSLRPVQLQPNARNNELTAFQLTKHGWRIWSSTL